MHSLIYRVGIKIHNATLILLMDMLYHVLKSRSINFIPKKACILTLIWMEIPDKKKYCADISSSSFALDLCLLDCHVF